MNKQEVKELISYLNSKKKLDKPDLFFTIADLLSGTGDQKDILQNEFEFSFIDGKDDKIRLLHLLFWKNKIAKNCIKKRILNRGKSILNLLVKIQEKFGCNYDFNLFKKFLNFNKKKNALWPIQFGLEHQNKFKPKIKVYLSINGDKFFLKNFCHNFNLKYKILKKEFKNRKFDTVAIDFLPDGDFRFKFYPIIALNKGKLYRVDKNTNIVSIKNWTRFPDGLLMNNRIVSNFIKLPTFLYEIIRSNNFRIHYLCKENGKKSVYFR